MVLGVIMIAAMLPTMIGLNEATSATRDQEERRRDRARKQRCHLIAVCDPEEGSLQQRQQVHNAKVYLGNDGKACRMET
jgi:cation transport regulator ChaB